MPDVLPGGKQHVYGPVDGFRNSIIGRELFGGFESQRREIIQNSELKIQVHINSEHNKGGETKQNVDFQIVIIDDEKKQFLLKTDMVTFGLKSPTDQKFLYTTMSVELLSKIITEGLRTIYENAPVKF